LDSLLAAKALVAKLGSVQADEEALKTLKKLKYATTVLAVAKAALFPRSPTDEWRLDDRMDVSLARLKTGV